MPADIVTGAISSYKYISLEIWYWRRMAYHIYYVTYNGLPSKEYFIQNTFKIYPHIMCSNCSEDYKYLGFSSFSLDFKETLFITQGQFVSVCLCISVCGCPAVCPCVNHMLVCMIICDLARITRFGPKVQNNLVRGPIILAGNNLFLQGQN